MAKVLLTVFQEALLNLRFKQANLLAPQVIVSRGLVETEQACWQIRQEILGMHPDQNAIKAAHQLATWMVKHFIPKHGKDLPEPTKDAWQLEATCSRIALAT